MGVQIGVVNAYFRDISWTPMNNLCFYKGANHLVLTFFSNILTVFLFIDVNIDRYWTYEKL